MRALQQYPDPSPVGISSRQRDAIAHLVAERNSLASRLEAGSRRIEQMRTEGHDVARLEDFWMRLLQRYEAVCDRLREYESRTRLRRAS